MSNRQLVVVIVAITVLALVLAWLIERTQVRQFILEFDRWWEVKHGDAPANGS